MPGKEKKVNSAHWHILIKAVAVHALDTADIL